MEQELLNCLSMLCLLTEACTTQYASNDSCPRHVLLQIPRPPRKDFYKLMNKDKIVMRFACRLVDHSEGPSSRLTSTDR